MRAAEAKREAAALRLSRLDQSAPGARSQGTPLVPPPERVAGTVAPEQGCAFDRVRGVLEAAAGSRLFLDAEVLRYIALLACEEGGDGGDGIGGDLASAISALLPELPASSHPAQLTALSVEVAFVARDELQLERAAAAALAPAAAGKARKPPPTPAPAAPPPPARETAAAAAAAPRVREQDLLEELFPELCPTGLARVLFMCSGDVDGAALRCMHFLASDDEADGRMVPLRQSSLAQGLGSGTRRSAQAVKAAIVQRYTGTWQRTASEGGAGVARPHITQVVTKEMRQKRTKMWRDNHVVGMKGERFTIIRKETKEQIRATSVQLAWIKRKRKSGLPGEGKIQ